ncbi:MAG: GNAT family N-acetyltransferase [Actinomycetota bacterium]|nr:GNAT family N-acetyltransferase [Actinomycetota bacterium]
MIQPRAVDASAIDASHIDAFELASARLLMRPLTSAYLAEMVDLYRDPEVTRFLAPLDEPGHRRRLEESERSWATCGYGRAAVHERSSGAFLGRTGLQYWPEFEEVEVGWAFRREVWGRGYATEAARAWIEWGFDHLDVPYLTANIHPENTASLAVARRLGMEALREDVFHEMPSIVHARFRDSRA